MEFFVRSAPFLGSKHFQLLHRRIERLRLFAVKKFHLPELLVGDAENAHLSQGRQIVFDAFDVYVGVFHTRTMAHVDGKLKHGETIGHKALAEIGIRFAFFFGFGRQIKKDHDPHDAVFAKTFHVTTFRDKLFCAARH